MNNLEDLLRALVTVIVRYDQLKQPTKKPAPNDLPIPIITPELSADTQTNELGWIDITPEDIRALQLAEDERLATLTESAQVSMILDASEEERQSMLFLRINKHETRRPLLLYLLHVIELLKQQETSPDIDLVIDHNPSDTRIQDSIFALLCNLKILTHLSAYASHPIVYDNQTHDLQGIASPQGTLAKHIQNLILIPLKITATTEERALELQAECLFLRHSTGLTATARPALLCALQENAQLKEEMLRIKQEQNHAGSERATSPLISNSIFDTAEQIINHVRKAFSDSEEPVYSPSLGYADYDT